MRFERRLLLRERGTGIFEKLWQIPWIFVLLLCAVAAVGYVALYSAGGGAPEPYAARHAIRFGFGLVMMLSIALVGGFGFIVWMLQLIMGPPGSPL